MGALASRIRAACSSTEGWTLALAAVASVLVVGVALASATTAAVVLAVLILGLLMLSRGPVVVAVLAVPAMWLAVELPGGIQGPDVLLTLALLLALPAVAGRSSQLVGISATRWAIGAYLAALVVATLVHPSGQAGLEILQRAVMTAGAVTVGAWLALEDRQRTAFRAFVLVGVPIAVVAVWQTLTTGFEPAYPLGLNKNFAGAMLAASLLTAWCAREQLGLRGYRLWLVAAPTVLGMLACRSRGALLGLALGLAIWFFRTHSRERRRLWWAAVAGAVGLGTFAARSVVDDLSGIENSRNTSVAIRTVVQQYTVEAWRENPWFGSGVRYWALLGPDAPFGAAIPPVNAPTEALAEAGVLGGLTWLVLNLTVLAVLWRRRGPWATAALAVFAGRLLHLLTDQGWNAGTGALPWLLVGVALGVSDERAHAPPQREPSTSSRVAVP